MILGVLNTQDNRFDSCSGGDYGGWIAGGGFALRGKMSTGYQDFNLPDGSLGDAGSFCHMIEDGVVGPQVATFAPASPYIWPAYVGVAAIAFAPAGTATPIPGVFPSAPTNVQAVNGGDRKATVTWQSPNDPGATGVSTYKINAYQNGSLVTAWVVRASTYGWTATGLTNGKPYTFGVSAGNQAGYGPEASSPPVTPMDIPPAAPVWTNALCNGCGGYVYVSWAAPIDNGGSAVNTYTVYASNGSHATTGPCCSIGFQMATGGPYTFHVTATNNAGTSPPSPDSNGVMVTGPPTAPQKVVATAGNAQATVTWTPPANDGGSPVTGYYLTWDSAGAANVGATATSYTATGLINGNSYIFSIQATNANGQGTRADSNSVTPGATVPGQVGQVVASAADSGAHLTWSEPDSGGSPITSYLVTASDGHTWSNAVPTTTADVTGLSNGTSYTFKVAATNSAGGGTASAWSNAITPSQVPGAPTDAYAAPLDGAARVSWSPPVRDGGNGLTSYSV
ncbi:MAG: fibronectin type III domain-containing protein, partial [Candidatus Dormibacteria bacterium]